MASQDNYDSQTGQQWHQTYPRYSRRQQAHRFARLDTIYDNCHVIYWLLGITRMFVDQPSE